MKHLSEEELFAYREGESKGREQAGAHLRDCPECRAELQGIEEVFKALDGMPVPDPGQDYGARVWRQIGPRLPEKRARWWEGLFVPRRLAVAGAMAAIVMVAFLAGRWSEIRKNEPNGATEAVSAERVRERVLVVAVREHLGKSEMVLVELSNAQPAGSGKKLINISGEQKRAEDLLEENRLYRQTAMEEGDRGMAATLGELERVLLDVANSPVEVTPAQFASIQKRIAGQGILLKVRVVRQGLRTESQGKSEPAQDDGKGKARNKA